MGWNPEREDVCYKYIYIPAKRPTKKERLEELKYKKAVLEKDIKQLTKNVKDDTKLLYKFNKKRQIMELKIKKLRNKIT